MDDLPAAQDSHEEAPPVENVPEAQLVQAVPSEVASAYLPERQETQLPMPSLSA
jgi:hypothetical protein